MGHTRIGRLNRSMAWKEVIGLFCAGADFDQIAQATLKAASEGFNEKRLSEDAGYQKAVWLLVQMGIAGQSGDFIKHMCNCGIELSNNPSKQELNARLAAAVEDAAWDGGMKSDLAEFARQALSNAVTSAVEKNKEGELPNMPHKEDIDVFRKFGSKADFAHINQVFASEIMSRGLLSYLTQLLPNMVGRENRVLSTHELNHAYNSIEQHCYETGIVQKDYANEWMGKHQYKLNDMSDARIVKHGNFLVKKMIKALKYGKE